MKKTKKYRPIEVPSEQRFCAKLREIAFSNELKTLFPFMFGDQWEKYSTLKHFVETFVQVEIDTDKQVLKKRGLMRGNRQYTNSSLREQFYTLLEHVAPEIEETLHQYGFLQ